MAGAEAVKHLPLLLLGDDRGLLRRRLLLRLRAPSPKRLPRVRRANQVRRTPNPLGHRLCDAAAGMRLQLRLPLRLRLPLPQSAGGDLLLELLALLLEQLGVVGRLLLLSPAMARRVALRARGTVPRGTVRGAARRAAGRAGRSDLCSRRS
jgi:hypothetical protein